LVWGGKGSPGEVKGIHSELKIFFSVVMGGGAWPGPLVKVEK